MAIERTERDLPFDERTIPQDEGATQCPLSAPAMAVQDYVQKPPEARTPVGYNRSFLDNYSPNISCCFSDNERAHLTAIGQSGIAQQPPGAFTKQILHRFRIDLAWNSSRLEGNTYSLRQTMRLLEFGAMAKGHSVLEAQMILNHRYAIEFLVNGGHDISFDRLTIRNLHAILADNLLDDSSEGRLRKIAVGIGRSVFHPLAIPHLIEEAFDQILAKAAAITDPFEQAFFVLVQLPYLQPFDDVNKRVSRLAANIPLIKANLCPLSFADLPLQLYVEAVLGVYELNEIGLLKEVFIWAYEQSAPRYAPVRQVHGPADPFRLRYDRELREIVGDLVRACVTRREVIARITAWSNERIAMQDRDRFSEVVETLMTSVHDGNIANYRVRPSEFDAWRNVWGNEP